MTNEEREAEIDRCCRAMIQAFEAGDLDQAMAWSRNMAVNVIPRSRGGQNNPENLRLLCESCNSSKGAKLDSEWAA